MLFDKNRLATLASGNHDFERILRTCSVLSTSTIQLFADVHSFRCPISDIQVAQWQHACGRLWTILHYIEKQRLKFIRYTSTNTVTHGGWRRLPRAMSNILDHAMLRTRHAYSRVKTRRDHRDPQVDGERG